MGQGQGAGAALFFLSFFCVPRPFCRALPTPQQPSPLPRSLIGSGIILFKSTLLWLASGGGVGQGARGKGQGAGAGHCACVVLFLFVLGRRPPSSVARSPTHRLAAATPSTSISPAWPYSYRGACTLPHLPRGFAQLCWAVVASLAWGFWACLACPSTPPSPLFATGSAAIGLVQAV